MSFFATLKQECAAEWSAYTRHPFVLRLGDGTLPEPAFRTYLKQDYLFLIDFARAYAIAVYKAPSLAEMRSAARVIAAILDVEMDLHVKFSAAWGLTPAELERTPPSNELLAYTRFVLDTGLRGDLLALKVVLAPCVIGYAEIGQMLATANAARNDPNPYTPWIAEYAGEAYQALAADAISELDRLAKANVTPSREAELITLFRQATNLETAFWQSAYVSTE